MSGAKGKSGRPKGKCKTSKIEVMMKPEMKEEFKRITESNGSNPSVTICQFVAQYIKEQGKEDNLIIRN